MRHFSLTKNLFTGNLSLSKIDHRPKIKAGTEEKGETLVAAPVQEEGFSLYFKKRPISDVEQFVSSLTASIHRKCKSQAKAVIMTSRYLISAKFIYIDHVRDQGRCSATHKNLVSRAVDVTKFC